MQVERVCSGKPELSLVAGLLFGSAALAQSQRHHRNRLQRRARSSPIADVVVTATSPKLQGEQTVVTDASGQYRIPQLPPGDVHPARSRGGLQALRSRGDIALRLDRTIRVNVELLPEPRSARRCHQGHAAHDRRGLHDHGRERGRGLHPQHRRGAARAPRAPRRAPSSPWRSWPRAPARTATACPSAAATSPENQYVVDGLSVNDPASARSARRCRVEFVQEVNVITGGYLPEYGRSTGGVRQRRHQVRLQRVPRLGVRQHDAGRLRAARPPRSARRAASSPARPRCGTWETSAPTGRPHPQGQALVLRGRGAVLHPLPASSAQPQRAAVCDDGPGERLRVLDAQRPSPAARGDAHRRHPGQPTSRTQRSVQYMGKLTYLFNPDHNLSVSVFGTPPSSGGDGQVLLQPRRSRRSAGPSRTGSSGRLRVHRPRRSNNAWTSALKQSSSFFDKKLLLDANAGLAPPGRLHPALGRQQGWAAAEGLAGLSRRDLARTRTPALHHRVRAAAGSRRVVRRPRTRTATQSRAARCTAYRWAARAPSATRSWTATRARRWARTCCEALGHHVFKAGFDAERTGATTQTARAPAAASLAGVRRRRLLAQRLNAVRLPDGPGQAGHPATAAAHLHVADGGRLRPGQLVRDGQGHGERGRALRRADHVRRGWQAGASCCPTSGRRAWASSTTRSPGPLQALRQLRPLLRERARWTWLDRSFPPSDRSAVRHR